MDAERIPRGKHKQISDLEGGNSQNILKLGSLDRHTELDRNTVIQKSCQDDNPT